MQQRITKEIEDAIRKTPYGSTENVELDDKKVIARYFNPCGAGVWYVLEDSEYFADDDKTKPSEYKVVFGATSLGYGLELGDISLKELEDIKLPFYLYIERDICVEPLKHTIGELRKMHGEEWM
jgi:hypothetical protein